MDMTKDYRGWLPTLVLLETFYGNWELYLEAIYTFFKQDFIEDKPFFRGVRLALKRRPVIQGKEATFWHLISEGIEEENRIPDIRRCERIRWPRPVIENCHDTAIKIWENERKGETRICLWLEQQEYLVIIARRNGHFLLWTAYLIIRPYQKRKLQKEYDMFWLKKASAAQKDDTVTPSTHGR